MRPARLLTLRFRFCCSFLYTGGGKGGEKKSRGLAAGLEERSRFPSRRARKEGKAFVDHECRQGGSVIFVLVWKGGGEKKPAHRRRMLARSSLQLRQAVGMVPQGVGGRRKKKKEGPSRSLRDHRPARSSLFQTPHRRPRGWQKGKGKEKGDRKGGRCLPIKKGFAEKRSGGGASSSSMS